MPPSRTRRFLAEWLLCAGLLLGLGAYFGYSKYLDHQRVEASERARLSNQALVIEKNLTSQLLSANRAMERLLTELSRESSNKLGAISLHDSVKLIADTLTGISPLLITNASGKIVHANVDRLVGFDSSVRDYFQTALKQRSKGRLFVSAPFVSVMGETSIPLAREITDANGAFGGVVVAGLDPVFFSVLLESVRFTPDTATALIHADGKLFMRTPEFADQVDKDLTRPGCLLNQHRNSGQVATVFIGKTCLSGEKKMLAYRTVQPAQLAMDKPLIVSVSRDMSAIYANWYREIIEIGWMYAGLTLMVCLGLYFYQQRRQVFRYQKWINESALRASDARLRSFFEATPDALLISDAHGNITMANKQVELLLGYAIEELLGQSIELLVPINIRDRHSKMRSDFASRPNARRIGMGMMVKAVRKDGSECDVEVSLSRIETDDGIFFASALRDITERLAADKRIRKLAFYDQLTGLPNRALLLDRLRQEISACNQFGTCGALLFIDLDHFKTLNDTLGHDVGDLQLKEVATRLAQCVRASDTLARVGGDEYAVILVGLGNNEIEAQANTQAIAAKILLSLSQPYQLGEVLHSSSVSIGISMFKGQSSNIDELMRQADLAMFRAKDAGRNALRFFDPSMEMVVVNRVALEKDLRHALAAEQFVLHYQAQVQEIDHVTGAEVLVRWQHPLRGTVPPADFIALAEETGVILALGAWVLETACTQLAKWAHIPHMAHLTLAVNVSALQFAQADFVEQVMTIVQRTGANPMLLKLELTESLLVGNVADIVEKMVSLKNQGVGFSLDDFGTGYSSLAYLRRLPLDQLKIDKSFIDDAPTNPGDAAIARTIIALANGLGLEVIAEGVETDAQRTFLTESGCHTYQGYLFSRPLPLAGFEAYMRKAQRPVALETTFIGQ